MRDVPVALPRDATAARYALGELLRLLGLRPVDVGGAETADIAYGGESGRVRIPAGPRDGWDDPRPEIVLEGDLALLRRPGGPAAPPPAPTELGFDALYATYACLTGPWEEHDPSDDVGTPLAAEGWLARHGLLLQPLVHRYAELLGKALHHAGIPVGLAPKPSIVLTHDVDDNFLHLFGRRESLELLRRDLRAPRRAARRAARLAQRTLRPIRSDPNDRFGDWARWQRGWGGRPAFFVAARGLFHSGSDRRDVPYDVRHPEVRAALRAALEAGAEIGVHFSLAAYASAELLRTEREELEAVVGGSVRSSRHHWWRLGSPAWPTSVRQSEAGIRVDCSLGFNDRAGFRRGIASPFRPFDRERGVPAQIWCLPTIGMDAAVCADLSSFETRLGQLRALHGIVESVGGALVLDWHVHAANPAARSLGVDALRAFVDEAVAADARLRTPLELADEFENADVARADR